MKLKENIVQKDYFTLNYLPNDYRISLDLTALKTMIPEALLLIQNN